ncbi:hypothetical protein RRG08_015769 [Elysia crispata]|uniref:Chitin-binding type-2 domain-containing protein n=1 Tax=Elysia crispata TaxID=231223 RepID=A0AAE0YN59_9GAST|nr:hypothetical protein RRG08_015769 [Elysia crispata]
MPACPWGQVWSNAAHNCVPETSRWNDCPASWDSRKSGGKYASYRLTKTMKRKYTTPKRADFTNKIPSNVKISRNDGKPRADKDFWGNLRITAEKPTTRQTTVKTSTVTLRDEDFYYDFWGNKFTSPPTLKNGKSQTLLPSDKNSKHYLVTPDWSSRRKHPHYPNLPTQRNDSRKKSRWFSQFLEDDRSKMLSVEMDGEFGKTTPKDSFYFSEDNPCRRESEGLFPHPKNCHWYYNCSSSSSSRTRNQNTLYGSKNNNDLLIKGDDYENSKLTSVKYTKDTERGRSEIENFIVMDPAPVERAGSFVWECRYPQLFDQVTGRCREFLNVDCQSRFEPYDQCEYSARQCAEDSLHCVPCKDRFGECRGRENGVYPLHGPHSWSPVFITCYLQRNIARDECRPPQPVFSPDKLDCVSLFEVPKQYNGFQPDCTARSDGYYPDEQGRCAIFFRCALGHFRGYDECPPGSVFDPAQLSCETYSEASKPCGMGQEPRCTGRMDGLFADPYGRCTHYFECREGKFQNYFTCDLGIFDPLTHRCVVAAELTMRPCGLQPSPCQALPTGMYPDQVTGCQYFIECYKGVLLTNGTCLPGTVFSALTGRCGSPELAPPPCGTSDICLGRHDGRYPATIRGCSFYFECQHGQFTSLRRCTADEGGYFFNPETGGCDYPQNICPPCGYRWWGW